MPITATLGALTYPRNFGTRIGNAWINVQGNVNNIQPGPNTLLLSTSSDIGINSAGDMTVAYSSDTWQTGYVTQFFNNGNIGNGISGNLSGGNSVSFASGFTSSTGDIVGCGQQTIVVGANFDQRIWVAKFNSSNILQWRYLYYEDPTTPTNDWSNGIKEDSSGNLYVVGTFGFNVANQLFLLKLNSSGDIQWARSIDSGTGANQVLGFDIDSSNNIYIVGKSASNYHITKFNSSGTTLASGVFSSGIPSGVYCKGSDVYVAIDTGFIKFDNTLTIQAQYTVSPGGSNTGLDAYSLNARRIFVDISDNIYISFPRVIGGVHYLYCCKIDSSYNLLWTTRIRTSRINNFNTISTSPTVSGIKYHDTRIYLSFRSLASGVNSMWVAKLPSDGFVPLNGIYRVGDQGFYYEKVILTAPSVSSYSLSGFTTTANLTLTRGSATIGSGGAATGWTSLENI
jgi:hypothetical protein